VNRKEGQRKPKSWERVGELLTERTMAYIMEFNTVELVTGQERKCFVNVDHIIRLESVTSSETITRVYPTQGDCLDVKMELSELVMKINEEKR